jgi:hypothetical protein
MSGLNRSERLAKDLGPLYLKSLAEKLTGSDVIDNYALQRLYEHLGEVGKEGEKAANDEEGRDGVLDQGGEADQIATR